MVGLPVDEDVADDVPLRRLEFGEAEALFQTFQVFRRRRRNFFLALVEVVDGLEEPRVVVLLHVVVYRPRNLEEAKESE